ncbi:hypothetical protein DEO72_LG4g1869 [Vigna unguiculata]|uniref:Uncharacterized protein n=1 Tax=Vigna unguiculata TaxID=3917 RepID=A0A4D6LR94_VIGUN|nr:hypothetical protein DEO72_LG4g1869 [Vigna unguiculata]
MFLRVKMEEENGIEVEEEYWVEVKMVVEVEVEKENRVEVEEEDKPEESMEVIWGRRREEEKGKFDLLLSLWSALKK